MEGYLAAHPQINTQDRIALTKFRLSNHDLMIEKGRHFKVEKAKRFCPFCPKTIETELHFLVQCNIFACLRRELFSSIRKKSNTFHHLPEPQKFTNLLSSDDVIWHVASFLRKSLQCRAFLLKIIKTAINNPSPNPTPISHQENEYIIYFCKFVIISPKMGIGFRERNELRVKN